MQNAHKKIETLANVTIIILALLLGGVLVTRYFRPDPPKQAAVEREELKAGSKLPISDLDWSKSERTLVMALSTKCHFCTESTPFYQKVSQARAGRSDVRLITMMPQSLDESKQYLSENKIAVDEVRQTKPAESFVKGTPTLIIVDRTGTVVESWVGKLPTEKEAEVMNRLFGGI
jgi:hypothetical protein